MKTIRFTDGFEWQREQRLLGIGEPRGPENIVPPNEQPQGEKRIDIRADQLPEEVLQFFAQEIQRVQQATEGTVMDDARNLQLSIQKQVDAIRSTPGMSQSFLLEYIDGINKLLHPEGQHASVINGMVMISPFAPPTPEQMQRRELINLKKQRIAELEQQLYQIDMEIREVSRMGFQQPAVEYRGLKGAEKRRRNIAPEVARMKSKLPMDQMKRAMKPLDELYAERFKIQQELAGVKSGRIPVLPPEPEAPAPAPAPEPGMPEQRFGPIGGPDSRFNLNRPENGVENVDQEKISRLVTRWNSVKTEEERETVEGFLMMEGVDVGASDLKNEKVTIAPYEERAMLVLVGFITVLKSFLDRLGNKKMKIDKTNVDVLEDPLKMSEQEKKDEIDSNDKKIKDLEGKRTTVSADIKKIEDELKGKPDGEAKTKLETDLKQKQAELKTIEEEIKTLTKRNEALKEAKNDDFLTAEDLAKDPFSREFKAKKESMKLEIRAFIEELVRGKGGKYMEVVGRALGIRSDSMNFDQKVREELRLLAPFMDAFLDAISLEGVRNGTYRLKVDPNLINTSLQKIDDFKNKPFTPSIDALQRAAYEISTMSYLNLSVSNGTLVSGFTSKEEILMFLGRKHF